MFLFAEVEQSNLLSALFDFHSNLLNWLLLVILVGWLINKYLPTILLARKNKIEAELNSAMHARDEAMATLTDQKVRLSDADREGTQIIQEAKETAEHMRIQIEHQTDKDVIELNRKYDLALQNERQLAISKLRQSVVKSAIALTQDALQTSLPEESKGKLLNQFVEQLDQLASQDNILKTEQLEGIH